MTGATTCVESSPDFPARLIFLSVPTHSSSVFLFKHLEVQLLNDIVIKGLYISQDLTRNREARLIILSSVF